VAVTRGAAKASGLTFLPPTLSARRSLCSVANLYQIHRLAMLRITPVHDSRGLVLKVEGKLCGSWTDELRKGCAGLTDLTSRPHLDLSAVSFIDTSGAQLLAELRSKGFALDGCTGFITAVMRAEKLL
jgi:hypothetical protein